MLRDVALLALIAVTTASAQDNGTKQEPDSFDVEPPLLVPNRADAALPDTTSSEAGTPDFDLAKLEKDFERAKRNADGAKHLYRIGVISQVELEQRALRVVRLEADQNTGRTTMARDDDFPRLGQPEIAREVILHLRERHSSCLGSAEP